MKPRQRERRHEADCETDAAERKPLPQEHRANLAPLRAERHPNPDLSRPLRDDVRDDAVDPDYPERERHRAPRSPSITSANDVRASDSA